MFCGKRIVSIGADAGGQRIVLGNCAHYSYQYSRSVINNFLEKYTRATRIYAQIQGINAGHIEQLLIQQFQDDQIAWRAARTSIKRIHNGRKMAIEGHQDDVKGTVVYNNERNRLLFDIDNPEVPFTSGNE